MKIYIFNEFDAIDESLPNKIQTKDDGKTFQRN
jgi:hypothetical protein